MQRIFVLGNTYMPFNASSLPARALSFSIPPLPPVRTYCSKHRTIPIYFLLGYQHFHPSQYPKPSKEKDSPPYLLHCDLKIRNISNIQILKKENKKGVGKTSARYCNLISFESISKSWRVADWLRRQIWGRPMKGCDWLVGWCRGWFDE